MVVNNLAQRRGKSKTLCSFRFWLACATLSGASLLLSASVFAQCPAVGLDTTCGVIITVKDTGTTITKTGQPPYDGVEDTLIGVVNNSSAPIGALDLHSGSPIFGFDGDGIVTYGIPGNSKDSTGYGGPNAYFTVTSATSGRVNFITPIAPGQTGFFSLEEDISSAVACSDLINKSVPKPTGGTPTISATFTPNKVNGVQYTLSQAATLCGFADFDWVQTIAREVDPNRLSASNLMVIPTTANIGGHAIPVHLGGRFKPSVNGPVKLHASNAPYHDPPNGGGYTYNVNPDYSFPFYCDPTGDPVCSRTVTTLSMTDTPTQTCMVDAMGNPGSAYLSSPTIQAQCGGTAKVGASKEFITHLAGVQLDGTAFDLGIGFTWTSNYNGTAGGVAVSGKSNFPPDPGSGTGGVVVTSYNDTTSYQYSGIAVGGVNGATLSQQLLTGDQVSVTASGLAYSRAAARFVGTLTITNISEDPISGPFQLVFQSLTQGITVLNASGTFGGFPFITASSSTALVPSQSITVNVQYSNMNNISGTFTPLVYSGSLQ